MSGTISRRITNRQNQIRFSRRALEHFRLEPLSHFRPSAVTPDDFLQTTTSCGLVNSSALN